LDGLYATRKATRLGVALFVSGLRRGLIRSEPLRGFVLPDGPTFCLEQKVAKNQLKRNYVSLKDLFL